MLITSSKTVSKELAHKVNISNLKEHVISAQQEDLFGDHPSKGNDTEKISMAPYATPNTITKHNPQHQGKYNCWGVVLLAPLPGNNTFLCGLTAQ